MNPSYPYDRRLLAFAKFRNRGATFLEGQVVQLITKNHEDDRNTKNRIRRAVYVELEALPAVDRRGMTRLGSRFPDIKNREHDMTRKTLEKR